jgi:hypothetical protein
MNTLNDKFLIVRCPYCVAGADFRPMASNSDGRFPCQGCGHTTEPFNVGYECECGRCKQWKILIEPVLGFASG